MNSSTNSSSSLSLVLILCGSILILLLLVTIVYLLKRRSSVRKKVRSDILYNGDISNESMLSGSSTYVSLSGNVELLKRLIYYESSGTFILVKKSSSMYILIVKDVNNVKSLNIERDESGNYKITSMVVNNIVTDLYNMISFRLLDELVDYYKLGNYPLSVCLSNVYNELSLTEELYTFNNVNINNIEVLDSNSEIDLSV